MTPAGQIHALTKEEAELLDRPSSREGAAWTTWKAIGRRLGVDVRPISGPLPIIERVGWQSIAVSYTSRECRNRPPVVIRGDE